MGCTSFEDKKKEFIGNFFNKNLDLKSVEKENSIFIKSINKKMKITKDLLFVEEDIILKVNLNSQKKYYNNFWIRLDGNVNDIKSKEIYIDDIKIDDSNCEVNNSSIKLEFEKTYNQQERKIRIIQKIEKKLENFCSQKLILGKEGILAKFLIYTDDDIIIDDISNKNYIFNKELNLAYFEGITNNETEKSHGQINYSKKIHFKIYQYIPELTQDMIQNIIINKEINNESKLNIIAKYKKIVMREYGQEIEEIDFRKVSNYPSEKYLSWHSIGLYKNIKNEIDLVEINGKKYNYEIKNDQIRIDNLKIYNNQYVEIHLKYKYFTNEDKDLYRQEKILISSIQNTYIKSIIEIPDNYCIISTKDIFKKNQEINNKKTNIYYYKGISKEDKISEIFKFCYKKAKWEIEYEYILEATNNIKHCKFSSSRLFKGGNLKEIKYDIIRDNANFIDSKDEDKFIFDYKNLVANKININFKIIVENSTSNYFFNENKNKELLTQIPTEDIQFFKDLANQIIITDKTNFPNYKKIGTWVYNHIKYNIKLKGKNYTAKEIYNIKEGVCCHYTELYNTILAAYGINTIKVSGYAKKINENNINSKKKKI